MSTMIAVTVGVTLLMVATQAVQRVLARRSAAVRALVWQQALTGAVAIALIAPWIPALRVPIRGVVPTAPAASAATAPGEQHASGAAEARTIVTARPDVKDAGGQVRAEPKTWNLLPFANGGFPFLLVWLIGALVVAMWWITGRVLLGRLARHARVEDGADWSALVEAERAHTGLTAPVRVLRSNAAGSPLTWGGREVIVLLPSESVDWSAERRRVVLAHELAHAARGDHRAQLAGSLACAVYWFHPLVWLASRRLRAESERACDDRVLAHGVTGPDYAAHLLDVARRSRAMRYGGMVAIGMARPSELEGRLLALLDPDRARGVPGRVARLIAWTTLGAIVLPLAAMRPAARETPRTPVAEPAMGAPVIVSAAAPRRAAPAPTPAARQDDDSTFERTLPASTGGDLDVDIRDGGGGVRITAWDEPRVELKARLAGTNWRDEKVSFAANGSTITLRSEMHITGRHDNVSINDAFELKVPRKFDVHVRSAGGTVTVDGLEGNVSGYTGGGKLTFTHVTGRVDLTTGGGEILLENSTLDGRVSTGGGLVRVKNVKGDVSATSGSGPVIREDAETGARSFSKAGGAIDVEHAGKDTEFHTGGGSIRIGSSEGTLVAHTGGGSIRIGPSSGSVIATTGAGDVEVTIVDGDDVHNVKIETGNGNATVWLPADLDAEFDLETAYTKNYGRKTRITSDFPLQQRETDTWDDSNGTPRKFVTGTGTAGSGGHRGRIRIVIVNGDITIRKGRP